MRSRPAGIRTRLLVALVLAMMLGLGGSTAVTAWALNAYLKQRVSDRLTTVGRQLQDGLAAGAARRGALLVDERQLDALLNGNTGLVLVIDGKPGFTVGLPTGSAQRLIDEAGKAPGRVVLVSGHDPAAAVAIPVQGLSFVLTGTSNPVAVDSLVLAISRTDDRQTVARLIRIAALVGLAALVLVAGSAVVIVRRGLRPLTDLAAAVQAVGRGERGPDAVPLAGSSETAQVAVAVQEAFSARARAEDRLRSFVADASHELRTPLTKIGGWADLYLQGGVRGEQATLAAMERIEAEAGRMGLLVEELSLLARLDAQVPLDLADVDLVELAEEVLEDARVVAAERTFTLHPGRPGAAPIVVRADAERLRRVLRNLVGNAVQHTPAGTPVEVSLTSEPDAVVLAVRDHGAGVPADQLPRLFERFWRAEASRSRAKGGSGLGLAIVEAVVVAHGGTVAARSRTEPDPAPGTTVTIRLPRRPQKTDV